MTSTHYHQVRGVVTGTDPGDTVEVWFEGGGQRGGDVHLRGGQRDRPPGAGGGGRGLHRRLAGAESRRPHYVDYYTDALAANGQRRRRLRRRRRGPHGTGRARRAQPLRRGRLGDRRRPRHPHRGPRPAATPTGWRSTRCCESRAYMNEGGKVLLTGDSAGRAVHRAHVGTQLYDPKGEIACNPLPAGHRPAALPAAAAARVTTPTTCCSTGSAATSPWPATGSTTNGDAFGADRHRRPVHRASTWTLNGRDSADNQDSTSSFVATSGILPPDQFQQFESWPSARWDKPGGPFDPHDGDQYVYSQIADVSYKRLTKEIAVPAAGGVPLTFWTSYDTEADWDYLFVEARTPGGDDWTTLPDANGHTTTSTGQSCPAGWRDLHPQLDHYQTLTGADLHADRHHRRLERRQRQLRRLAAVERRPVGVRREDRRDLDRLRQRLGHPGHRRLPRRHRAARRHRPRRSRPGWTAGRSPVRRRAAARTRTTSSAPTPPASRSAAAITTPHSLLLGFGFEGISTAAERNAVMGRALDHLLD